MQPGAQPNEQNLKHLHVLTLNYSGILDSPFQFYSNELENQQRQMSEICHQLIKLKKGYSEKEFKWKLGKIDQKCQKNRYSPLYNPKVGTQGGRLLNKQEFEERWEANFKPGKFQFSQNQKCEAKEFDFLIYSTLVAYSNHVKDLNNISFKDLSAQLYLKVQSIFFSKSFLNEQKKIEKTINLLKKGKADAIFLQETTQNIRKALINTGQFYLISKQGSQSIILMRVKSFKELGSDREIRVDLKYSEMTNWNSDTIWCVFRNIVFISAHLSSKSEKNQTQVARLWKDLLEIRKREPELHVIVGIDANNFLHAEKGMKNFHLFPSDTSQVTTNKKRTWMQPQANKADVVAKTCRDHLISDLPLINANVTLINGINDLVLIPTESHPYDHYLVSAQITVSL